ncbi:hypothetical protein Tco_0267596 [Tanacetum coccineum]
MTAEIDECQARSDPSKTPESRPPPEHVLMEEDQTRPNPGQSHVALAGPDPEPMHDDFVATVYPQVHESLKHTTEEHVHLDNPLSSSGTLSSMKNLEDNFTFSDQFINDKPTKEDPGKSNMETKVESMVTVPIHQASSSIPPLSTPVIDLTPSKPVSSTIQEPIFTATTEMTTTTLPLPPPPPQQSSSDPDLASQLRDLSHKINQTVNEVIKEAVQTALQAPLRDRFKDLPEADMKEILHQWMFENGSYKSHPEHKALYEALEVSMDRDNQEALHETLTTSRKRHQDEQDPPSRPPKRSDQSNKMRHDSDASDDMHLSDSEDIGADHLPKIKTRPNWLKPIPEEETPDTPEPDWVVPLNDLPEPENNWADAISESYQDPKENKLLRKTGDMGSSIKWYCKRIRKSKFTKADLEGPTFKLVKPFHKNNISLQF